MHAKRLNKKASDDFEITKKKYELFRKQFNYLHVKEDFIEILKVDDVEDEIVIIEDEEQEVITIKDEEKEYEVITIEDEEEEDDEDEAAIFRQFSQALETFMDEIKDENLLIDRNQNIINLLDFILEECKSKKDLTIKHSKLKAIILAYHPDKNSEDESKFWMAKCNAISVALNELKGF